MPAFLKICRPSPAAVPLIIALLLQVVPALALGFPAAERIDEELLAEAVPTAFEVAPFVAEDFKLQWDEAPASGVAVHLVPGSLTWVRVSRYLVLPRARVRIQAPDADSIQIRAGRFVQDIPPAGAEAAVSLFGGDHELTVNRAGKPSRHRFWLKYAPLKPLKGNRIFWDVSCSPYSLAVSGAESLLPHQWAYLACRTIHSRSDGAVVPQVQLEVAWVGADAPRLHASGDRSFSRSASRSSLFSLILTADSPKVRLEEAGGGGFEITATVPGKIKKAFLGLGLGPYSYQIEVTGDQSVSKATAITTIYGSYFLSETSRIVFFDAFPIHSRWYNDFGLYFNNETSRTLDERLTVNLLLGFHWIAFSSPIGVQYRLGVPQGFEIILRDAFGRRKNASVGGFFYPPIDGKSYYNTWARVGTSRLFAEMNYLAWSEKMPNGGKASSESIGVCIGAPLLFF